MCDSCQKEIVAFGSKSFDGKSALCIPCFVEKKKREEKTYESTNAFPHGKRMKTTYITDGGMIFQKDSSGNFYHDGERVSGSEMKETLKSHGRVYDATRPELRRFVETQEYAYTNRKR